MTKRILLTGASGDIGSAIKECFEKGGYAVSAPPRKDLDLARPGSVLEYFTAHGCAYEAFVYCAGMNNPELIEKLPLEKVIHTMQVNLFSFYEMLQHLIPHFKGHGGSVVAISSIYGSISRDGRSAYSMSKHALNGLIKAAAIELGRYGVTVNTVSPGFVDTQMTRKNNSPKKIKSLEDKIPLGTLAQTSQIAQAVYYLCNENKSYISGQDIIVDGGFMAGGFQQ